MSGDVYDRNKELVTRVYILGVKVFDKNEPLASRIMGSIVPLLGYKNGLLSKLRETELAAMGCIKKDNISLVYRALQGESIDDIAKDIPELAKVEPLPQPAKKKTGRTQKIRLEDSGAYHTAIRALEGE